MLVQKHSRERCAPESTREFTSLLTRHISAPGEQIPSQVIFTFTSSRLIELWQQVIKTMPLLRQGYFETTI
jgi:hypothetical protein